MVIVGNLTLGGGGGGAGANAGDDGGVGGDGDGDAGGAGGDGCGDGIVGSGSITLVVLFWVFSGAVLLAFASGCTTGGCAFCF